MEKIVLLLLVVMCVSLSIMFMCILCGILYNWNRPPPDK